MNGRWLELGEQEELEDSQESIESDEESSVEEESEENFEELIGFCVTKALEILKQNISSKMSVLLKTRPQLIESPFYQLLEGLGLV